MAAQPVQGGASAWLRHVGAGFDGDSTLDWRFHVGECAECTPTVITDMSRFILRDDRTRSMTTLLAFSVKWIRPTLRSGVPS